jgi:hypothetical protein
MNIVIMMLTLNKMANKFFMEQLTYLTFLRFITGVLSSCGGCVLALGLAWVPTTWATPHLFICPGPLFTNDLTPTQAKSQGCEPASRGRWSQAQSKPEQDLADTEPGSAKAATPMTAEPGSVLSAVSPSSTTAKTPTSAASAAPAMPTPLPDSAGAPNTVATAPAPAPATSSARRAAEPVADASRQRQRDSHARDIVLAELARTQARIQTLLAQPPSGPDAESALLRLRLDEDALRRELARRPG